MDPDEGPIYTIDAMKCGNESHFINHSVGLSKVDIYHFVLKAIAMYMKSMSA